MLNSEDIKEAYSLVLSRLPENETIIAEYLKKCNNIFEVFNFLLNSKEFENKFINQLVIKDRIPSQMIVFPHIPKTAGTYLRTGWLLNNVNKNNVFWHGITGNIIYDLPRYKPFSLIGGHVSMSSYLRLLNTNQTKVYITLLRDPIKRIISFYNFIKNIEDTHIFHSRLRNSTLYDELIFKSEFYHLILNDQIKYIVVEESLFDKFKHNDIIIIGKQEKINIFIDKVNNVCKFNNPLVNEESASFIANKGGGKYIYEIKEEKNYDKALEILAEITKKEYEFYNMLNDINVLYKPDYEKICLEYQNDIIS